MLSTRAAVNVLVVLGLLGAAYVAVPRVKEGYEKWEQERHEAARWQREADQQRELSRLLDEPIVEPIGVVTLPEANVSLNERVKAGNYNYSQIGEPWFKLSGATGPRSLVSVWFKQEVEADHVIEWSAKHGYEVARIDELLAMGADPKYRNLPSGYEIVAIGSSSWDGRPSLYSKDGKQSADGKRNGCCVNSGLGGNKGIRGYFEHVRFLLVRPEK